MSGRKKVLKRHLKRLTLQGILKHCIDNQISIIEVCAMAGIEPEKVHNIFNTGNLQWYELTQMLLAINKWVIIDLVEYDPKNLAKTD